jgi:DNA-binding IclR family transcriptional regulator
MARAGLRRRGLPLHPCKRNAIPYQRPALPSHHPVERAIEILLLLGDASEGLAVTAIAEALGMPASGAHRLLGSLVAAGVAEQDPATRRYRLTLVLPALGLRHVAGLGFVEAAQPELDRLAAETGELARLAIVERDALVWVAKAQGAKGVLRIDPMTGRAAVPHVTAAGKAWLATLSDKEALRIARAGGLGRDRAQFGPGAIGDARALAAELTSVRERGFATTLDEAEPGVAAVGAAIRRGGDRTGRAVATVSLAGPSLRLPREALVDLGPRLLRSAAQLGAIWPACTDTAAVA